jgi:hypothetical protein
VNPCASNPCKNTAKCVNQPSTFYGYNCQCPPLWTGINCDQRRDRVGDIGKNYKNEIEYPFQHNHPNHQR